VVIKVDWTVYIILCGDNSLYTGITNDLDKRLAHHNSEKGAKYLRGRKPLQIVYVESGHNRSSASRRENQIKRSTRQDKIKLIHSEKNVLISNISS
jgi:putative endonuclease